MRNIQSVIIVDTETTGLDPATCAIIELAGVLYDIDARCVAGSFATLIHAESNAAEGINRIPVAALASAPCAQHAWNRLGDLIDCAGDAVFMAHRAEFDQGFIAAKAPRLAGRLPWLCSKFDVEWPLSKPGASCVEMALAHGVPVVSAHRALTDCMLIARTLENVQAAGHDLHAMLARALRPKGHYVADTPKPWEMADGEWPILKGKLHSAGFRFEENGQEKRWVGRVAHDDVAALPFAVREVKGEAA